MTSCSTPAAGPLNDTTHGGSGELSWSRSQSGASTPLPTPREAHEDPFNLVGFFPSRHAESQKEWSWIYGREEAADADMDASAADDFSVLEGYNYDEFAQKVIEGEDKYGMLASERISSLLRWEMPVFGGATSVADEGEQRVGSGDETWGKTVVTQLLRLVWWV